LLVTRLRQRQAEVISVMYGERGHGLKRIDRQTVVIDPADREAHVRLFAALAENHELPAHVCHLGRLGASPVPAGRTVTEAVMEAGFFPLLNLLTSARPQGKRMLVCLVGEGMVDLEGRGESVRPESSALIAATLVAPRENAAMRCRVIDLPPLRQGTHAEAVMIDALIDETGGAYEDPVVALRGRSRWTRSVRSCTIPQIDASGTAPWVKVGGVYLLTGGLGHVGRRLAEHLATAARACLILTGRQSLPPRDKWQDWLAAHPEDSIQSVRIRSVQRMEAAGATVEYHALDAADRIEMRELARMVRQRYGELSGVFHLAGQIESQAFCLLEEATEPKLERSLHGKAGALPVLEELMAAGDIGFCVVFSSLAAWFGGLGNILYATACQYADAFVQSRNAIGPGRWLTLNWDLWNTPRSEGQFHMATLRGLFHDGEGMEVDKALAALESALQSAGPAQILVSTGSLAEREEQFRRSFRSMQCQTAVRARSQFRSPFVAPRTEIEVRVADIWKDALGWDAVGIHDSFFELGGDSLVAVRCVQRLRETFQIEVPLRQLIECPTVAGVTKTIESLRAGGGSMTSSGSLLVRLRESRSPAHEAGVTLVCVPYAGGSGIMYQAMAAALPDRYSAYAVETPHSGTGPSHPTGFASEEWVQRCVDEIIAWPPGPIEIYGHCGGVIVALEIARLLEGHGRAVSAVFAGAVVPFSADGREDRENIDRLRDLSNEDLASFLRQLGGLDAIGDPAALRSVVDSFRSDAHAIFNYYEAVCHDPRRCRLMAPIYCVVGDRDPLVRGYRKRAVHWKRFGERVHLAVLRGGGHYFVRHQPLETAHFIATREGFRTL
jgi:surfactin synthase thioesterase subunit/acyl carrier protein/nucleoside-diphosphate-sugar epimerase